MRRASLSQARRASDSQNIRRALSGGLVAFVALSMRLFVWPRTDPPLPSDAIVVLDGSPRKDRRAKGLWLARSGNAPVLVLSVPKGNPCTAVIPGVSVICFSPDPASTQGEARHIAKLARDRNWRRIIVVPATTQTTRARLRFKRCWDGKVLMDPVGFCTPWRWAYPIVYEWGALAKALLLQRTC